MNPTTSIVMTAYNRGKLVGATLDSIFCQKYDFEVIVVEDGNDGETEYICKNYPVRYVCRRKRPDTTAFCNPSIPNNIGIKMALGKVLIIQNAENKHITADSIKRLSEAILANNDVSVFASVLALDKDGKPEQWYCHPIHNPRPLFFCQAVDRDLAWSIRGFDEDYKFYGYDDDDFSLRLSRIGVRFIFRDDILLHHQWHPTAPRDDRLTQINANLYMQKLNENPVRNLGREWGQL